MITSGAYQSKEELGFGEGQQFLDESNAIAASTLPWIFNDPIMSSTPPTWLPFLEPNPAILFTYRHPIEVAKSMAKRDGRRTLVADLTSWMRYNRSVIENSSELSIVQSNLHDIMDNLRPEANRIIKELTTKCGVLPPPVHVTQEAADKFVDTDLQHQNKETFTIQSATWMIMM